MLINLKLNHPSFTPITITVVAECNLDITAIQTVFRYFRNRHAVSEDDDMWDEMWEKADDFSRIILQELEKQS